MNPEDQAPRSLREIELAVEAEGREWTRQRLREELQKEADLQGGVFPPERPTCGASSKARNAAAHRSRAR